MKTTDVRTRTERHKAHQYSVGDVILIKIDLNGQNDTIQYHSRRIQGIINIGNATPYHE